MYTQKEISKMSPKFHPSIKMADKWGGSISKKEYDEKFDEFKTWAKSIKKEIVSKYGETAGETFLDMFATSEVKPFLRAGFEYDYDYLNKLIKNSKAEEDVSFLKQELGKKLHAIRESVTIIALNSNAIWGAKKEFSDDKVALKDNVKKINKHTINCLTLLAPGELGGTKYLSNITKDLQKYSKQEVPTTDSFVKGLRNTEKTLNKVFYNEWKAGFINSPEA
jgi:hypothetical protein